MSFASTAVLLLLIGSDFTEPPASPPETPLFVSAFNLAAPLDPPGSRSATLALAGAGERLEVTPALLTGEVDDKRQVETPAGVRSEVHLTLRVTNQRGVVTSPGSGSPNRLLFVVN